MYPAPQGPLESPEQMRDLDDTFLTSDPYGYFVSRIGMLHAWAKSSNGEASSQATNSVSSSAGSDAGNSAAHLSGIGRPDLFPVISAVMGDSEAARPQSRIVSAQVAVDAFALRHHVA